MIKFLCNVALKSAGWKFDVNVPSDLRSFLFLGAPHTSNFDFFPAMGLVHEINRNAKFIIKNDWLKFPLNLFMEPIGAIGLDREKLKVAHESNTDLMANLFKEYKDLMLMIAPEGTRKRTENWKTGFYYIAQKANVPIILGFADYEKKIAGTGPIIYPSDFESDMRRIMEFYEPIRGYNPDLFRIDSRFR